MTLDDIWNALLQHTRVTFLACCAVWAGFAGSAGYAQESTGGLSELETILSRAGTFAGPNEAIIVDFPSGGTRREQLPQLDDTIPPSTHTPGGPGVSIDPTPINPPDMRIARVFVDGGVCSGALISPFVVLTAGHCIHGGQGGSFVRNVEVALGFNSGAGVRIKVYEGVTFSGWADGGDRAHDLAALRLSSRAPPEIRPIGMFPWRANCREFMPFARGFEQPHYNPNFNQGNSQFLLEGRLNGCYKGLLITDYNTAGGSSGSPILSPIGRFVFAVHTAGLLGGRTSFETVITPAKACYIHNMSPNVGPCDF